MNRVVELETFRVTPQLWQKSKTCVTGFELDSRLVILTGFSPGLYPRLPNGLGS